MPIGRKRERLLAPLLLDVIRGLHGRILLERDRGQRIHRVHGIGERRAAGIELVLARVRRIKGIAHVGKHRGLDAHQAHQPFDLVVVPGIGIEARNDVDLPVRFAFLACPERFQDPLHHVVIAHDMRTHKARGVRERDEQVLGNDALLLRRLDVGVQIVADHLRHAGRRDRDHLRLVQGIGVLQAFEHVVQAAEHRRVLGHGGGDRGKGLLEVAGEVAPEIGHAALGALHERHGAFETRSAEHRAERLAGLGGIDLDVLPLEIELLVLLGLGPVRDLFHLLGRPAVLELLFALELLLIVLLLEQLAMVSDFHDNPPRLLTTERHRSHTEKNRRLAIVLTVFICVVLRSLCLRGYDVFCIISFFCIKSHVGLFTVMSMSRAKTGNPSNP